MTGFGSCPIFCTSRHQVLVKEAEEEGKVGVYASVEVAGFVDSIREFVGNIIDMSYVLFFVLPVPQHRHAQIDSFS